MEFSGHFGTILNIAFTLLMLFLAWLDFKSFGQSSHKDFKSIIMSIGVLGTFVGIFVGLLGFDTHRVEYSIPTLLEGLKVAFYTSIAGMSVAIFLAVIQKLRTPAKEHKEPELAEIVLENIQEDTKDNQIQDQQTLIASLNTLDSKFEELLVALSYLQEMRGVNESLESLHDLISEDNKRQFEQLELQNSHFDRLEHVLENNFSLIQQELKEAVRELAKGASEGLIGALAAIIKDFNSKLNEQFGQNFQELNQAVGKMVSWQENYKETLLKSHEVLESSFETIKSSAKTFEEIANRNQEVMDFYSDLKIFITEAAKTSEQLQQNLKTFTDIKDDAKDGVHAVKVLFENALDHLSTLSERMLHTFGASEVLLKEHIKHLDESSQISIRHLSEHLMTHSDTLNSHISNNSNTLKDSFVNLGENFKQFSQNLSTEALEVYRQISQQIQQDSALFVENINQQSVDFKEGMHVLELAGKKSFVDLKEHFENISKVGMDQLNEIAQKNTGILQTSLKNSEHHFEVIRTDVKGLSEALKQHIHDVVSAVKQEVDGFGVQVSKDLQDTSHAITDHLKQEYQTSQLLFEERQKFIQEQQRITKEGIVASANAMVKQNRSFLEGVGSQTKEFFTQSLQEWQKDQKEIIQNMLTEHKRVSQSFDQLAQTLFNHFTSLSNNLHSGFDEVKGSLKILLKNLVEDLKQGNEEYNNASLAIMESNIANISQKIVTLQELSHQSMDTVAKEYISQMKALIGDSVNIPKEISIEILNEIENLQKNVMANILTANQSIVDNKKEVRAIIDHINANLQNELDHTQKINSALCHSLEELDRSLANLTQGFKGDYEWFLRRISDFMGSHRN